MMTSTQIRQSFLDFFKSKQHTIVPSASLMPDSPNLLFTNAGMNQFVPIFLGQTKCPYTPGRAADTQKCIRAGGKHNDLDDVGLDTYHLTFFEMLGNWSFGDYFKKESLTWGWELLTKVWGIPPKRLFATVYSPDKSKGDPAEFDQEAADIWTEIFRQEGLDPKVHIVHGNKKDNFWMMGETGPCGPCSEIHFNLLPSDDEQPARALVNAGSQRCIEIWNHVFIQFNANPDGAYSPLPAKHVDTGMGFDRLAGFHAGTKGFKEFSELPSAYNTDIFTTLFAELERLSEKKYTGTLPSGCSEPAGPPALDPDILKDFAIVATARIARGIDFEAWATETVNELGDVVKPYLKTAWDMANARFEEAVMEVANSIISGVEPTKDDQPSLKAIGKEVNSQQVAIDIAFRVIADHIRTLSFAIADGIQPGNTDRNYVLRRILRRAVRYGRTLGFHEPFFYKLVDVLADTMGDVFPEIRAKKKHVQEVIRTEEESFNKTLDRGITIFNEIAKFELALVGIVSRAQEIISEAHGPGGVQIQLPDKFRELAQVIDSSLPELDPDLFLKVITNETGYWFVHFAAEVLDGSASSRFHKSTDGLKAALHKLDDLLAVLEFAVENYVPTPKSISGLAAFVLYDTYGFPVDLTELMARERGLSVDAALFNTYMEDQRRRARAAQKKEVISLSQIETTTPTKFVGYDVLETGAKVVEVVSLKDKTAVILDTSACYAEMGGQVGDTGELEHGSQLWRLTNTQKSGNTWLHFISDAGTPEEIANRKSQFVNASDIPVLGSSVTLTVDKSRRSAIERHHTVTHLLHWALHEVVSQEASQKGSFVGPDKLTFDFNSAPLTPTQVADIEKLVNERILENTGVSWTEVAYADVKSRKDVMQFFGDKYGDTVRVVQIGGHAAKLDGYSMELCGGTHTRATGEIGLFRIVSENAIASGVRRIEAIAGLTAYDVMKLDRELIKAVASKVNSPVHELESKITSLVEQQRELEKALKAAQQREASNAASLLLEEIMTVNGVPAIIHNLGAVDGDFLQLVADSLKGRFKGVVVLGGGPQSGSVALVASVSSDFTAKVQAGKIIQQIAPLVGGKGGGKPDNARGGGRDASKLGEALAKAKSLLG